MKRFYKVLALILTLLMMVCSMAGCSSSTGSSANKQKTPGAAASEEDKTYKIGIIQYMAHPSLDNCYKGIVQALDDSGIKYDLDYQVGSANSADSDCTSFAKNMVAESCDIIFAIATPAAQAAFNETADTDIPVIFSAVTDPVSAKLVESNQKPGSNATGTSDVLDLSAQVDLIQTMQPDVSNIGILYTSSEQNSLSNLDQFQKICDERNITVTPAAVQNASDIPAAAEKLASQVDCINNFTDNNVVNNLSVVLSAADKYGIPVYGSEVEQVKNGCLASVSLDYVSLGVTTGQMGLDVLNGQDPASMAVKTITDASPVINTDVLGTLGLTLPDAYKDAETVTTNK